MASSKNKYFSLFIALLSLLAFPKQLFSDGNGIVIAFAGLSGSGKTTMAETLANLYSYDCITEPEEIDWPDVIKKKDVFGNFAMWMGFRQLWLPQQFEAQDLKRKNKVVFLDSFFIKMIGYELEEPDMEWLFPRDDPYFPIYQQICKLDIQYLPDPDCIVLFDISYEDWLKLLASRNREWDKTPGFIESYQQTKQVIEKAVELLCKERGIRLIYFQAQFGDIAKQALRLQSILRAERILKN